MSRCSLIVLCAALTACQSPLVSVPANDAEGVGIAYALPRQLVKLTVVRSDKTTRKQYIETLKGQKAAAEKALEPIDTSIGALMKLRGSLAGATGPKAKEAVKTIDARVEALSAVMAAKKAEIDGKAAEIETLSQDAKADCVDSISLALLPPEPDPNHRYVATLGHSIFRDDKWLITTTPEGLLSSADTVIADRSADVVVELARSAALVAKAITMVPLIAEGPTTEEGEEEECIPFRNEHIFDPDTSIDPNSPLNWAKANETLRRWGLNTTTVTPKPERQFSNTQWPSAPHGLHYRRPIPYTIEIEIGGAAPRVQVVRFQIPNGAPVDTVAVPSLTFVTATQSVKFEKGMLTQVDSTQPSQAVAIAKFPGRVAQEVISVPAEMLQLKIDYSSKEAQAIEAEKAIVDAQKALLESEQALKTALDGDEAE